MGRSRFSRVSTLWLLLALAGAACGEENGDPDQGGELEGYAGKSASGLVKAAEGGELSVGAAKLKVPAGGLDKDTELTLKAVDKGGLNGKEVPLDLYELVPEDLVFKMPAELEFDVSKIAVGSNKRLEIAEFDKGSGNRKVLPNPKASGKFMSVKISRGGSYSVVLVDKDAPAAGQCGADFVACGGDLTGSWGLTTGCITASPASLGAEVPAELASCSEKPSAAVVISLSGTVSFNADSSYSVDQSITLQPQVQVTQACLDQAASSCAELEGSQQGALCVIQLPAETQPETDMGTWSADGSRLSLASMLPPEAGTAPVVSYCVEGDTLTIRMVRASEQRVDLFVAQRK
jgi:hypothetical protein